MMEKVEVESIREEDRPVSKREILLFSAIAPTALAAIVIVILFVLGSGCSCDAMASGVMGACVMGAVSLFLPVFILIGSIVLIVKRCVDWLPLAAIAVYYAIFIPLLVFVPPWQKVVPNVERAYAEFKTKHAEPERDRLYAKAEWWGNLTKPLFDRLARRGRP